MIEVSIIIYFAINIFLAGYYVGGDGRFNSKLWNFFISVLFILFGAIICVGYFLLVSLSSILAPIYKEIIFSYKFYLTKYFDNIYLNDEYSDVFKTLEEKLEKTEELAQNSTDQLKRHNKLIQNKYGSN